MKKFVCSINGCILKDVKSLEEWKEWFKKEGIKKWELDDENDDIVEMDFDKGIERLVESVGEVSCYNEELCEMGDDYCELNLEEVEI